MMTTAQRLQEIQARADAATAGPWDWEASDPSSLALGTAGTALFEGHVLSCPRCKACQMRDDARCLWPTTENSDFIAHSRADIPFLLELVATLQAELREVKQHREKVIGQRNQLNKELTKARMDAARLAALKATAD